MSEITNSPSPTNEPSSTGYAVAVPQLPKTLGEMINDPAYANAPIVNLLKKPLNEMTQDELRAYVAELRGLRQNPHSLGKALRGEAARKEKKAKEEDEGGTTTSRAVSLEDLMKQLGG